MSRSESKTSNKNGFIEIKLINLDKNANEKKLICFDQPILEQILYSHEVHSFIDSNHQFKLNQMVSTFYFCRT